MRGRLPGAVMLAATLLAAGCQGQPAPATPAPATTAPPAPPTTAGGSPGVAAVLPTPTARTTPAGVVIGDSRASQLAAANQAFARGEYGAALAGYEQVAGSPPRPDESAAQAAAITGLAELRALLVELATGREEQAQRRLADLRMRAPDSPFVRLAVQVYDQYSMTGDVRAACAQASQQVPAVLGPALAALASADVPLEPGAVCTIPR